MDIKQTLVQVFANPWLKKIPAPSLIASTLAAVIHAVLSAAGFELSAAAAALAQVGFKVGAELLPSLIEAAKKGIEALGDWLEKSMAEQPEANEAAARTMIDQAETVAEAIQETRPSDKDEIAEAVGEGMKAYGGATAEIAEPYAAAMKDVAALRKLVEQMREKVEVWASQTVEAKRGSLIENVEQYMKGRGGRQEIRAEDDSVISGVKQVIDIE
jgi:uncharacterized membrane-anchored protein